VRRLDPVCAFREGVKRCASRLPRQMRAAQLIAYPLQVRLQLRLPAHPAVLSLSSTSFPTLVVFDLASGDRKQLAQGAV